MCGFVGVFEIGRNGENLRAQVLRMSGKIRHRGPDWSGIYCGPRAVLSHERLSIVDPQSGGQPLYSPDGRLVLAVNGEIYNHRELRRELAGEYDFRTGSDCEVILPLYRKYGAGLLDRLNGIFAFALYDIERDEYLIARDPVGVIPLYIGWDADERCYVASELKALEGVCNVIRPFEPGHYRWSREGKTTRWYTRDWFDYEAVEQGDADPAALRSALEAAVREAGGFPCVFKTRTLGYDGHGQVVLRSEEDMAKVEPYFGRPGIVEEFVAFDFEASAIVVGDGRETVCFPVGRNVHRDGILDLSVVPAEIPDALRDRIVSESRRFMQECGYRGILAIEYFVKGDEIYFNEMAPRPHNSGHWTIEGCTTNQFRELARYLLGMPLEEPRLVAPTVMKNILGRDLAAAQAIPMRAMAAKENSIGNNITVRILAEIYPIARIWIFRRKSKEKRNPAKRPKSPAGKRQSYFQAIKDRRERRREYFIRPPV